MRIAASSKGEQRKALAAWDPWWAEKRTLPASMPSRETRWALTQSLSPIIETMARRKDFTPRGKVRRLVSSTRSNFNSGFSCQITPSRSPTVSPACSRQKEAARAGSSASFFLREKRSSWAKPTSSPSTISAAAESWK